MIIEAEALDPGLCRWIKKRNPLNSSDDIITPLCDNKDTPWVICIKSCQNSEASPLTDSLTERWWRWPDMGDAPIKILAREVVHHYIRFWISIARSLSWFVARRDVQGLRRRLKLCRPGSAPVPLQSDHHIWRDTSSPGSSSSSCSPLYKLPCSPVACVEV